jgi:hypothetical protein
VGTFVLDGEDIATDDVVKTGRLGENTSATLDHKAIVQDQPDPMISKTTQGTILNTKMVIL